MVTFLFKHDIQMKNFSVPILGNITRTLVTAIAASLLVMFPGGPAQMAYATSADCSAFGLDGDGTPGNPMKITSSAHLASISDCVTANPGADLTYEVVSDIDMSSLGQISPFPIFEGSLIGDGHVIDGISISGEVAGYAGLFAQASGSALVMNLTFRGSVENTSLGGGSTGLVFGHVTGDVAAIGVSVGNSTITSNESFIGGLFGTVDNTMYGSQINIESVTIETAIDSFVVGGLAGQVGTSAELGQVTVKDLNVPIMDSYFGGLIGMLQNGGIAVEDINISSVSATSMDSYFAAMGGLVGYQDGSFTGSNIAVLETSLNGAGSYLGGHVGYLDSGTYTADSVSNELVGLQSSESGSVGGFVGGMAEDFSISNVAIFETLVVGNAQFVGGAVGFVQSGNASIQNYHSTYSGVVNIAGSHTGGLVGSAYGNVNLNNVSLENMFVEAGGDFGSFGVGFVQSGELIATNVLVALSVISASETVDSIGGLLGSIGSDVTLRGITLLEVEIKGNGSFIGGLIGFSANSHVSVSGVSVTDLIVTNQANDDFVAGLLAAGGSVSFSDIVARGVDVSSPGGDWTGGLVGMSSGGQEFDGVTLEDFTVAGYSRVGGLSGGESGFGSSSFTNITVSGLAIEAVTTRVGGLTGTMQGGTVSDVIGLNITISAESELGGLVGATDEYVSFANIDLENTSVSATADNVGGVGGAIYGPVSISHVSLRWTTVTGDQHLGGVLGFTTDTVTASHIQSEFTGIGSSDSTDEGRVGGVIGFASGHRVSLHEVAVGFIGIMTQTSKVGGIIGFATNGVSISNYAVQGAYLFANAYAGAVIGHTNDGITATSGYLDGNFIEATSGNAGGFAGFSVNSGNIISQLVIAGTGVTGGGDNVAGLIGYATGGTVLTDVEFTGINVVSTGDVAGGLLGFGVGTLTISRAVISQTSVSGAANVGGLIGHSIYGVQLEQVLLQGTQVTGSSNVGDFIGRLSGNDHLLVSTQSYIVYVQSSSSAIANIAGSTGSASLPVEISASEALDISTFIGWDFDTYFGLRCSETPATVGLRAVTDGLFAVCIAPSPSNPSQVAPVTFVYQGPNFSSISPKVIWSASNITLIGNKLDLVTRISVDGIDLKFTVISSTQIELVIPAGLSLGKKDLKVEHSMGSLLVGSAFEVIAPPVVLLPKVTVTTFNGRVWIYFKNVSGKALVVKIGSKWHRVPNNGTEVVSFTRKSVKGKTVMVSAYIAGVKVATNSVRVR